MPSESGLLIADGLEPDKPEAYYKYDKDSMDRLHEVRRVRKQRFEEKKARNKRAAKSRARNQR